MRVKRLDFDQPSPPLEGGDWGFAVDAADPVGAVEIAERLGVKRATVDQWQQRTLLPPPRWKVGGRPAWDWSDIAAWAESTGRITRT